MKSGSLSSELAIRLAGRLAAVALSLLIALLVGIQFARVIGQNVAMERELHDVRSDIASLERRRVEQQRELLRLQDPLGAVPEIHDRLRLVRSNEAIIFLNPVPSPAP
jgi:septal ring factor EnvC (AmiA/AmiB activator)